MRATPPLQCLLACEHDVRDGDSGGACPEVDGVGAIVSGGLGEVYGCEEADGMGEGYAGGEAAVGKTAVDVAEDVRGQKVALEVRAERMKVDARAHHG